MTDGYSGAWTRTAKVIAASPGQLYEAFTDPEILLTWLPPADMTSKLHAFDARVGGGYRMSLFYSEGEQGFKGKTADKEDMVDVRFVELSPRRIVEAINFVTDDPALKGQMTMTATFEDAPGGTQVVMLFEDLPPGLRPEDNDAGAKMSLDQLARLFG